MYVYIFLINNIECLPYIRSPETLKLPTQIRGWEVWNCVYRKWYIKFKIQFKNCEKAPFVLVHQLYMHPIYNCCQRHRKSVSNGEGATIYESVWLSKRLEWMLREVVMSNCLLFVGKINPHFRLVQCRRDSIWSGTTSHSVCIHGNGVHMQVCRTWAINYTLDWRILLRWQGLTGSY